MSLSHTLRFIVLFALLFQVTIASAATSNLQTLRPVTLKPTQLTLDDPELVNPGRGFYRWRGEETVPLPEPAFDEYDRYFWHDPDNPEDSLETAPGVYNFSKIDQAILEATSRGHKFAFRIRTMANKRSGKRFIPDYLSQCGWEYRGTFIPDWNTTCFLDNAEKLMKALGERYDNNPAIAWIDLGLYGEWGEWALSADIYTAAPQEIKVATDESLARIIDMQVNAFPKVRKVMMAKTRSAAVIHALKKSDQIGWRVDCFGRHDYFNFPTHPTYMPAWKYMQDRWKTAPVIVEFCADNINLSTKIPLQQVEDFHISLIGNGNFNEWDRLNDKKQANLILIGKTAGYRYQIHDISIPEIWAPGATIRIATNWENVGVAPHYEPTDVLFRLYDPRASKVVWEGRSGVDLQKLLPTGDQPQHTLDQWTLPAQTPPGVYQFRILVTDPTGYRPPLKLALLGRQTDGSYLLGNVSIGFYTKGR